MGLGAAVACPNRKTVVLEGDGSGMYTPQTLWTMAREKADVTLVVMKNDSYAILNIELARVREGDPNEKMLSILRSTIRRWTGSRLLKDRVCRPAKPVIDA